MIVFYKKLFAYCNKTSLLDGAISGGYCELCCFGSVERKNEKSFSDVRSTQIPETRMGPPAVFVSNSLCSLPREYCKINTLSR